MVILYAESSTILAWLLDEPEAGHTRRWLRAAEAVIASDLTVIECDRVLHSPTRCPVPARFQPGPVPAD